MITNRNPKEYIESNFDNFDIVVSSSSIKYILPDYSITYKPENTYIKKKDLSMFTELSRNASYLIENGVEMPEKKPKFIDMSSFAKDLDRPIWNIYEIDLRAAYWKIAKMWGLMNEDIFKYYYDTNSSQRKYVRNMSIGALAKKETFIHFSDKNYFINETRRKETHPIFWQIAKFCGDVMEDLKILSSDSYLFFWVDAIFVLGNKNLRNDICRRISKEGLGFKIVEISKIWKSENILYVSDSKKLRKFSVPQKVDIGNIFESYK